MSSTGVLCQKVSNISLGPLSLENAELCFTQTGEYTGNMNVKVYFLGYDVINDNFPVALTVPWYQASSQTQVAVQFGNPITEDVVTLLLNIGQDINELATALGYSGVLSITDAHIDANGDLVFTVNATSPPVIIILAIIFVIALAILVYIGGQSASAVITSINGVQPSPPNCAHLTQQECAQQYQLYYKAYQQYSTNKGISSIGVAVSGSAIALGIGAVLIGGVVIGGIVLANRRSRQSGVPT